jgi:hypothetical protein
LNTAQFHWHIIAENRFLPVEQWGICFPISLPYSCYKPATQEPIGFASLKAHPRRCFVAMRFPLKIDNRSLEAFLHISIFDNELNNNAR